MDTIDTREWLLTNGLGSFASGTVCDARTRTYHGWLIAAIAPPAQRTLLLSHIDAYLWIGSRGHELGTNFWNSGAIAPQGYQQLQAFGNDPIPTWTWGDENWRFTREILLPYGLGSAIAEVDDISPPQLRHQVLVRYHYQGVESAVLSLRPLIGDRNFHHQQQAAPDLQFSQLVEPQRVLLQASRTEGLGVPWQLSWSRGDYTSDGVWYRDYRYPEETSRGLGDREDLFSPGYLTVTLKPGDRLILRAEVRGLDRLHPFTPPSEAQFTQKLQQAQTRFEKTFASLLPSQLPAQRSLPTCAFLHLLKASDQFIAYRASIGGPTVIAGYPWFGDWGRDTLIALPGLALTPGRFELARGLLETFGKYCRDGLIPNTFPDVGEEPAYNSIDAVLWWIETLGLYLEATQDWAFLEAQYPVVRSIYKAFVVGTSFNIRVDARDGLLVWEAPGYALTWMDAVVQGRPVTPRQGKPVEINALWYGALCWAQQWAERLKQTSPSDGSHNYENHARRYAQQAEQVRDSLQKFWNPSQRYLYDSISPNDLPNRAIRPNAILALSLQFCGFEAEQAKQVLQTGRDRLLTPYGLRSLDPSDPHYIGCYQGQSGAVASPTSRDRAYHQGTVWSWLIGPFIRAWKRFYPNEPLPWNPNLMLEHLEQQACLGSISEIFDGDAPHEPRGAIAQAWSVAELLRHWQDLTNLTG